MVILLYIEEYLHAFSMNGNMTEAESETSIHKERVHQERFSCQNLMTLHQSNDAAAYLLYEMANYYLLLCLSFQRDGYNHTEYE